MHKILLLILILSISLMAQVGRDNFLGGYDVTVDLYPSNGGALCSYWKAIRFTPQQSGDADTLKWGYVSGETVIDSVCLAIWTVDYVNNRPKALMCWGLALNVDVTSNYYEDLAIEVTNVPIRKSLSTDSSYFISMYTSSTVPLLARGNATTCVPNPRKIGTATTIVAPPPAGGAIFDVVYSNNCYAWGAYTAGGATPPSEPTPIATSTDSIYQGIPMTVSGTEFGIKIPAAPLHFEDFEDLAANDLNNIQAQPHYSQASPGDISANEVDHAKMQVRETSWTIDGQVLYPPHSNSTKYAGAIHYESAPDNPIAYPYIGGGNVYRDVTITTLLPEVSDTVYVFWLDRMHPAFPVDSCQLLGTNFKEFTMNAGTVAYGGGWFWYFSYGGQGAGRDFGPPSNDLDSCDFSGGQIDICSRTTTFRAVPSPFRKWVMREVFIADSSGEEWADNILGHRTIWDCDLNDVLSVTIGGYWRMVLTGANPTLRGSSRAGRAFDDHYADITYSRVMLGNAPTYEACTILAPQPPVTWSNTAINFTPNLGMLSDETEVYLYVFNKLNVSNTNGLLIPVGGQEEPPLPGSINITIHKIDTLTVTP